MSDNNNKASPLLPDIYQVQCPSPVPSDWGDLMFKAAPKGVDGKGKRAVGSSDNWYRIDTERETWKNIASEWNNAPKVSYQDWRDALLGTSGTSVNVTNDYTVASIRGKKVAVHCKSQQDWDDVIAILVNAQIWTQSSLLYRAYDKGNGHACNIAASAAQEHCRVDWYEDNGYQIITTAEFLAANGHISRQGEYKIGDWIIGKGGCLPTVAKKLTRVEGNKVWYDGTTNDTLFIRLATPQEIASVQDVWRVGDKLPNAWLREQDAYTRIGNRNSTPTFSIANGDRIIQEVVNGYGYVSGTGEMFLKPKHLCSPIPKEQDKKAPKNGKEWICTSEDGVELYKDDIGHWVSKEGNGNWKKSSTVSVCRGNTESGGCLTTGNWKVFSTEKAAKEWLEKKNKPQDTWPHKWKVGDWFSYGKSQTHQILRVEGEIVWVSTDRGEVEYSLEDVSTHWGKSWIPISPPTPTSTMVTVSNVRDGMLVTRGKDWCYGDQDGGVGQIGIVQPAAVGQAGWRYVLWPNGAKISYRIGHNSKFDLYIATGDSKGSNNNQSSINNQNDREHVRKQCSSGKGPEQIIVSGDPEEPSFERGNRRTGTPGESGGELFTALRGHKGHGKVFEGCEEGPDFDA